MGGGLKLVREIKRGGVEPVKKIRFFGGDEKRMMGVAGKKEKLKIWDIKGGETGKGIVMRNWESERKKKTGRASGGEREWEVSSGGGVLGIGNFNGKVKLYRLPEFPL